MGNKGLWEYGNMGLGMRPKWGIGLTSVAIALAACGSGPPIRVTFSPGAGGQTLSLLASPGYRINARLAPALELTDGRIIRFSSTRLTPDSNYFTAAPAAWLAATDPAPRGLLRAGVCREGETVCRVIEVAVTPEP